MQTAKLQMMNGWYLRPKICQWAVDRCFRYETYRRAHHRHFSPHYRADWKMNRESDTVNNLDSLQIEWACWFGEKERERRVHTFTSQWNNLNIVTKLSKSMWEVTHQNFKLFSLAKISWKILSLLFDSLLVLKQQSKTVQFAHLINLESILMNARFCFGLKSTSLSMSARTLFVLSFIFSICE